MPKKYSRQADRHTLTLPELIQKTEKILSDYPFICPEAVKIRAYLDALKAKKQ
jgi:hypothetical protein